MAGARPGARGTRGECTVEGSGGPRARVLRARRASSAIPFYAFHDRDLASHGKSLTDANAQFDVVGKELKKLQKQTGIRLLWGTAQNFVHPRYMHGAATSCNADAFCFAAAQVKKAMEWTHELGGEGYVFWGGREGYSTLLNTDLKREMDHLATLPPHGGRLQEEDRASRVCSTSSRSRRSRPSTSTTRTLRRASISCASTTCSDHFKLNLEVNHAWLAGKSMEHELEVAGAAGALGSIDANMGDYFIGWDTDQFPTDLYLTAKTMLTILKYGGLTDGRRELRRQGAPRELHRWRISSMRTSPAWTPSRAA